MAKSDPPQQPSDEEIRNEFTAWIQRVCQGDQQAIDLVIQKYGRPVLNTVRRALRKGQAAELRELFDSAEFQNMVFAEFFMGAVHHIPMETEEDLRAYLCAMATKMVARAVRDHVTTEKRSLQRQESLTDEEFLDKHPLYSKELSPEESARIEEFFERLQRVTSQEQRRVLRLHRFGLTYRQIADETGLSTKSIQRIMTKMRQKFFEWEDL